MPRQVLEIVSSKGSKRFLLTGKVTVGRDPSNSLAFADTQLSAFHFLVESLGDDVMLRDLGSEAGTLLNGQKVAAQPLRHGDTIQAGRITLRYLLLPDATPNAQGSGEHPAVRTPGRTPAPAEGALRAKPPRAPANDAGQPGPLASAQPGAEAGRQGPAAPAQAPDGEQPAPPPRRRATVAERAAATLDVVDGVPGAEPQRLAPRLGPHRAKPAEGLGNLIDMDQEAPLDEVVAAAGESARILAELIGALPASPIQETQMVLLSAKGRRVQMPAVSGVREAVAGGKDGMLFLRGLLYLCLRAKATDLHIEPKGGAYEVRMRIDGMMVEAVQLHRAIGRRLQRVVKVLGELDLTAVNAVQEGQFGTEVPGRHIHYRISYTPALHGQKLVLRVLDEAVAPVHVQHLGLPPWMESDLRKFIRQESGTVLVCGPTGSGKTTTLYALIRAIDRATRNVVTIENPVECQIEGTTQLPIDEKHGQSFSEILRSVLRQDPDVLLVGEIRDQETASIAMQAALTGHLVLSTVHARDSIGTIFRLFDLGVESHLVAAALNRILAQRLARKLCVRCRHARMPQPFEATQLHSLGIMNVSKVHDPVGCRTCMGTGYSGRFGIYELLTINDALRDIVLSKPQVQDLRRAAKASVFHTLRESGFRHVADGTTSFDEIDRIVGGE